MSVDMTPDIEVITARKNKLEQDIKHRQAFEAEQLQNVAISSVSIATSPYSQYKTDLNYADILGNTLLHYACMLGDLEAVKEYISQGADMSTYTNLFASPIAIALSFGHLSVAQYLF